MNRDYQNSYWRDVKKIVEPALKEQVEQAMLSVREANTTRDIPELKKMKGYKIHYRIKVGKYRIGVTIENDLVTFKVFDHRKDFYKRFP